MQKLAWLFALSIMCIAVEAIVKWAAFNSTAGFFDLGSKLCLWSTGTLSALAMSDRTVMTAKVLSRMQRQQQEGLDWRKTVEVLKQYLSPRYHCLVAFSLGAWVICLVLSGRAFLLYNTLNDWNLEAGWCYCCSLLLGVGAVTAAVLNAKEDSDDGWRYE